MKFNLAGAAFGRGERCFGFLHSCGNGLKGSLTSGGNVLYFLLARRFAE